MNSKMSNKTEGLITSIDYRKKSVKLLYLLFYIFLALSAVIAVFPVIWAFLSGFKELSEYYGSDGGLFPKNINFGRLASLTEKLKLSRGIKNSFIIFLGTWVGEIFIGGLAGYTISRLKPKGSRLLFRLMLWTLMMPHTLTMVPMFMTWTNFPLIHINFQNTFIPFWIPAMANLFNILLFKNFYDGIPETFVEAAKIDGCTNVGIFFKIIVPLSTPIISTVTVFVFNGCWNNFMGPFLYLKDKSLEPVALSLYNTTKDWTEPDQLLAAFVVMVPAVIVFALCSKQILGNSMSSGIKG